MSSNPKRTSKLETVLQMSTGNLISFILHLFLSYLSCRFISVSPLFHVSCEGTRKIRGSTCQIKKYYYQLHIDYEGMKRMTDQRFRKEVYEEYENIAVIHYIGDSLSRPKPHGNSRQ